MKRFFPEVRKRIRLLLFGMPGGAVTHPVPTLEPDGQTAPQADPRMPASAKPGRPISAALSRTIDALAKNPRLAPAELASLLSVSPSYARTLLRRARARQPEPASPVRPAAVHAPPVDLERTVHNLSARLTETESHLAALRAIPVHGRTSMNLNRRAEVLRLAESGESTSGIATTLGIPVGEVEFTLKIDRLLTSAVQSR